MLAEQLRFHSIWTAEHRIWHDGRTPAPLDALALVAGRTSRLRMGTAVLLAAVHDPFTLAGTAATLDRCSGGRLDLGVLDIMPAAWAAAAPPEPGSNANCVVSVNVRPLPMRCLLRCPSGQDPELFEIQGSTRLTRLAHARADAVGEERQNRCHPRLNKRARKPGVSTAEQVVGSVEARRRPRKRRDQEVIDAATKVFYERGFAAASVQDVADELGILKGASTTTSRPRRICSSGCSRNWMTRCRHSSRRSRRLKDLGPLQRLELYVRKQVLFNLENLPRVTVYYNDYERLSPDRRAQIVARRRVHERYVTEVIEEAQRAGEANPELDARLLSNFIHGAFIWTYRWYHPGGKVSREKIADTCAEFALRGVGGVKRSGRRR